MDILYKIRNKKTNLFASKGSTIDWNKKGSVYNSLAHVKSHLANSFIDMRGNKTKDYPYEDAEIIEYIIKESTTPRQDVNDVVDNMINKKNEQIKKSKENLQKREEEREREVLKILMEKYKD